MGRPEKERYIYLYAVSVEEKARYEDLAKQAGVPLSKFLLSLIEEGLARKNEAGSKIKLVEERRALADENKRLRDETKVKNLMLEKYESEIRRLRSADFLSNDFKGRRHHDPELIASLKRGPVHDRKLMEILNISDPEDVKALSRQLEDLEAYGIIAKGSSGWRWLG